jgi:hypothetical protein
MFAAIMFITYAQSLTTDGKIWYGAEFNVCRLSDEC